MSSVGSGSGSVDCQIEVSLDCSLIGLQSQISLFCSRQVSVQSLMKSPVDFSLRLDYRSAVVVLSSGTWMVGM